ncbi:auxin-responsive protein SAUR41 [Raphanus sativus]|uniref:Auxin-responsive protein SAUR41 n=1 Tax=Raphanus sativus TaxID=3726 RepID=A0A6J0JU79_RAPSA|nr:auxin-responsive protein SAUR41 [Raphanus sativus]
MKTSHPPPLSRRRPSLRILHPPIYLLLLTHPPRSPSSPHATAVVYLSGETSQHRPAGHVPVYVGEEMERFAVSAELLNHPVFVGLLDRSAQEYGYAQKGVLHIPCHVIVFERVVETVRLGFNDSGEIQELVALLLSGDELIAGTTE